MIELSENDNFILAGDWHGSKYQAGKVVERAIQSNAKVIFQLGDFGIWDVDMQFPRRLNNLLQDSGITLYFVDGNHENFPLLYTFPIEEDGTRKIASNIFHLPRGFRFEMAGLRVMALGGAASIDLNFREEGESWWSEESLTDADIRKAVEGGKVDVMLCHDSPEGAPNSICDDIQGQLGALNYFGSGLEYCTAHRKLLAQVTNEVTPAVLFHGHYHRYMEGAYMHENGTLGYVFGLDQGNTPLRHHTKVMTPRELTDFCAIARHMPNMDSGWK